MHGNILCFGELLLRFTAPGNERFMQTSKFNVFHGGAEANVAVSLSRFGHRVDMVSAVPGNPFGCSMIEALRGQGVDTSNIRRSHGRMGIYFLENGAVRRPSRIIYDREDSVFANTQASEYDWEYLLKDVDWLHISGITPAVGAEQAKAALQAAKLANKSGVKVSFDGNYRAALWEAWGGDGPKVLRELLSCAHTAFINEKDVALILESDVQSRGKAVEQAFANFPNLQFIANTRREQSSVADQNLTGEYYTRGERWSSRSHKLDGVVDRIGGGDAFAAGVLHGQIMDKSPQAVIDFAIAASAIKHSIPGDWNLTTVTEVTNAIVEDGLDVKR